VAQDHQAPSPAWRLSKVKARLSEPLDELRYTVCGKIPSCVLIALTSWLSSGSLMPTSSCYTKGSKIWQAIKEKQGWPLTRAVIRPHKPA